MTTTTNSPKAQAEAMSVEVIKEWRLTGNALVSCISTALEKLLTENERLKGDIQSIKIASGQDKPECGVDTIIEGINYMRLVIESSRADSIKFTELQDQLTATEAKLETAKLETAKRWIRHDDDCKALLFGGVYGNGGPCICGLDAFLSTLTDAKKEEAK